MSSHLRRLANRCNALRSTGPRTDEGKSRSAQNARVHGLTAGGDAAAVLACYRDIINDPAALLPVTPDSVQLAALRLASAEARLDQVRAAEARMLAPLCPSSIEATHKAENVPAPPAVDLALVHRYRVAVENQRSAALARFVARAE